MRRFLIAFISLISLFSILFACTGPSPSVVVTPSPAEAQASTLQPPPSNSPVTGLPSGTEGYPWWNDTVFYEIFVRSFYDSNGDGLGDLNGLISKLDYLNDGDPNSTADLGVTGLWLMPINPAISYHGYDVTDYYSVNPDYGTNDDFKRLVTEAHRRGIRIVIDFVINHTSDQHSWFQQAKGVDSPFRDWYIWADSAPTGLNGWYDSPSGAYYANFQQHMPDLNYKNPEVTAEIEKVAQFWLTDMGVDGFRVDGAKHLVEEGSATENTEATHTWFKNFRVFYKGVNPEAITVGEVFASSPVVAQYAKGDEFDLLFAFDLAKAMSLGAGLGNPAQLNDALPSIMRQSQPNQFATFLTNHDQDRIMSVLGDKPEKAKVAATLMLTAPGAPFLYYGEEIGLLGKKPDQDIRLPMQWAAEPNGGFTTGRPWRAVNGDWETKNVAIQTDDPDSLLSHYRALIRIRSEHAALRVGDSFVLESGARSVYGLLRVSESEVVLVVVNLGKEEVADYGLSLQQGPLNGVYTAAPILGEGPFEKLVVNGQGGFDGYKPIASLLPFTRLIIQLQK